ncbi:class I adenylate-forming enzyme family protein [Parvibaculum sp.]|uniref:class I adenylate-forming enzyme family protein n=1 Tax=Parvibaculum sp. TaxID=2024848 RepID=UPI00320D0B8A
MIADKIYEWARVQPEKTAVIHNDAPFSYAAFARSIETTRLFLEGQDLPAGRTAIVLVQSLIDAWVNVLALRALGLNTICVSSLAVASILNVKDIACVVITQAERARHNPDRSATRGAKVIVVPAHLYRDVNQGAIPIPRSAGARPGNHILYTSGTTGLYKKLVRPGFNEDDRNALRAEVYACGRDSVFFAANFPLWTSAGFDVPLSSWHAGGTVVLAQGASPSLSWLKHDITWTILVPQMLKEFLQAADSAGQQARQFDLGVAGGFLSLDLAERASRLISPNISIRYGATEYSWLMQSQFNDEGDLYWLAPIRPGMFQIVNSDGTECPMGQEGELRVRLANVDVSSYLDDDETTAAAFRDGYFYPGDLATRREDGRIRILGRTADVLNVLGIKVAVAPLEANVQKVLGVNSACLFSGLNNRGQEELVIALEAESAPSSAEMEQVARSFPQFEHIRFEVLEKFPRTEAGMQKIKRSELRKLLFGGPDHSR